MENCEEEGSACGSEFDFDFLEEMKQADAKNDKNVDPAEIQAIITKFAEIVLQQTVSENNALRKIVTHDSNTCSQILDQKAMLLCGMSPPVTNRLAKVVEIGNLHKQVVEQFHQLYIAEEKHLSAYAEHCDKAILATGEEGVTEYDEYTLMPYSTLCEHKLQLESQYEILRQAGVEEAANHRANIMKYESEYNSILNESELFEEYKLEALAKLDELNFELKKARCLQKE